MNFDHLSPHGAERQTLPFACDLILHFGYHKCLTMFYMRLMQSLSVEFSFRLDPAYDDIAAFHKAAINSSGSRIVVLTDRDDIAWGLLPVYRASHFIRDPRDLVVSGYFYHLWTKEAWCQSLEFNWSYYTKFPLFELIEPNRTRWPTGISYQTYLKNLDRERGFLMEMIFRESTFQQMRRWRFNNPQILEMRYENIAGNEETACYQLFDHYGFSPLLRDRALQLVREIGLKSQAKREGTHIRSGEPGQWARHFTPSVKEQFKQVNGDLLVHLGYEGSVNW